MEQVAMGRVELDKFKTGLDCTPCGRCERRNNGSDPVLIKFSRRPIGFIEWDRTRPDRFPTACIERQLRAAFLRDSAACFASSMRELNARHRAHAFDERRDSREHRNVIIAPDAQVAWRDPSFPCYRGCLGDHEA